ncbi:MAG: glycosyl transferase [Acidimicrobiaceae bacterium]|nr:glycosyl transferase [Acidimicrobiaceae bacterium]
MTTTLEPPAAEVLVSDADGGGKVSRHRRWGPRPRPEDPAWARPALGALLIATALLYLWGLDRSGWANSFYSAAVESGTKSWKAFFFGSLDSSNFITVDKPPASLWVMELSARLFGLNSWSILAPQALEGVATVAILYATVRRWLGARAGLIAGAVLALTPVAALMFRYNNPDALLALLLMGSAYAIVRAVEQGHTRWLVLAGVLVGTGFITKMLQALFVLPALGLVYLVAGPPQLAKRVLQLLAGGVAMLVAAGWWVAAVELTPAKNRPYIGGSQNNNLFNLIFGYNGFGRLTGSETGSSASQWGPTGWDRLFMPSFGGQISWLIPAALILLGGTAWMTRGRPRTDRTRAGLLLWGTWLIVSAVVLSYGHGIIHPYYTVALAAPIGALVALGATVLWRRRQEAPARAVLAAALAAAALWSFMLLGRSPQWIPALRFLVLAAGVVLVAAILKARIWSTRMALAVAGASLVVGLAGPTAYSVETAASTHSGAIPSAGPTIAGASGFGGGGPRGGPGSARRAGFAPGQPPGGRGPSGFGRGPGGGGGLLNSSSPSAALVAALEARGADYSWVLAVVGSDEAAGYELATDDPVMAIGGFNGTDPAPSLASFEQDVRAGKIHYFIASGGRGSGGGATSSTASAITSWVESNFTSKTVGGTTVYDLTSPTGGS